MRFLFLLFILAGCSTSTHSSYQQTARPAVYRPPPVNTPGYYPGTPAEPVYTPNGAGLPGERVPGTTQSPVQRSPNKRILPPTKEPGLWAADTVKASFEPIHIDVGPLTYIITSEMRELQSDFSTKFMRTCAGELSIPLNRGNKVANITKINELECAAAWLMTMCLKWHHMDEPNVTARTHVKMALDNAKKREKVLCAGGGYSTGVMDVYEDVLKSPHWNPKVIK